MDTLKSLLIDGEPFYQIADVHTMRPFFMSMVSDANHWLFISSNGGLSAGRKNAEFALFPYYTDDKLTENAENTGSKTILRVNQNGRATVWEPFSVRSEDRFAISRNLYQSRYSNQLIFEEINHDLQLVFRYRWSTSHQYGFVRQAQLINQSEQAMQISLLDGLQNILPYGVPSELQHKASNLVDAYKRTELIPETGLALFALSAIIVDRAEPSEALKANVVWSAGLPNAVRLVAALQLQAFRQTGLVQQETDIKGEKGAYFVQADCTLAPGSGQTWYIMANVNQTHAAVVALNEQIKTDPQLLDKVTQDIHNGTQRLIQLAAAADALQYTADDLKDTRHFSNVLFNTMRGGILDHNYQVEKPDFERYLRKANPAVAAQTQNLRQALPDVFTLPQLKTLAKQSGNPDLLRLATEYLPLRFSRRHGDPSRPWNQFSINTINETDGSKVLDYQGNWRDLFQNWETLAHSYPACIESMIYKFLNASTFEGYNPYRVTKDGFDWETVEPHDPWAYIGYWGDHQIIYLLKFLEFAEQKEQGAIAKLLAQDGFVYANVPYKIKPYSQIVQNHKDTIVFDHHHDARIRARMKTMGGDGALLANANGQIHRVTCLEKILATLLAKIANFVPEGGIWLNTQRPEWNDANNALVGNGVSMVTLYYLQRFLSFFAQQVLPQATAQEFALSAELYQFFNQVSTVLQQHAHLLAGPITDQARKQITDQLGEAASLYRSSIYEKQFSGEKQQVTLQQVHQLVAVALQYTAHTINANKRPDHLYHAYNLLQYSQDGIALLHLSEMLEGQVAVLSAKYLNPQEALQLLNALRNSRLYRPDQDSYILYPNKELPGFLQKNNIPEAWAQRSALLQTLLQQADKTIVEQDVKGGLHFNGSFKNADDLFRALDQLPQTYQAQVQAEKALIGQIFEEVFNHKAFTGRSGTFYAYEGLGSIYWHMVSKLLLAVQENCLQAIAQQTDQDTVNQLVAHYYHVAEGIGVHKSPRVYGAFPVTPYSHTPAHRGAQQPGMTGQVKEDVLCRFGELGIRIQNGQLCFSPHLLRRQEWLAEPKTIRYFDVNGTPQQMTLEPNSLFFTICGVPVIYQLSEHQHAEVWVNHTDIHPYSEPCLSPEDSQHIFERNGKVTCIKVYLSEAQLPPRNA